MTVESGKAEEQLQSAEAIVIDSKAVEQSQQEAVEKKPIETTQDEVPHLLQKIEELTAALETTKDQALRTQADAQNTKRRAALDVEKAHRFALDQFVESLLPVIDSLEKGIESTVQAEGSHEAMKEGMELTLKLFQDTLSRFNVKPINPEGEPFDPNFHQAMSMVPNPEVEPNTVIEVFQKGYTLNERVVRPAMVVVSANT